MNLCEWNEFYWMKLTKWVFNWFQTFSANEMKWLNEWMNEWIEWMNEWIEWMNEWNYEWIKWMNEWMKRWMNEMVNEINFSEWNEL